MTNLQAIQCEVTPYATGDNQLELEKGLLDAGKRTGVVLAADGEYSPENERTVALAAVFVLYKYISLSSETESQWSQGYNDKLKERVLFLCNSNGIDASEFVPDAVIKLSHASNRF